MKRIYIYNKGLYFKYKIIETFFNNKYFNNEEWFIREEWDLRLAIDKQWFGKEDFYYDGISIKSITFFKLSIGLIYDYDSRPLTSWKKSELPK